MSFFNSLQVVIISCAIFPAALADSPLREEVYFFAESCKSLLVELRTGSIKTVESEAFSMICNPSGEKSGGSLRVQCLWLDEQNKVFARKDDMIGAVMGLEAVIATQSKSDVIFLNLTSQRFYAEANINLRDGLLRGKKICSGFFSFGSDLDNDKKESKK